MRGSTYLGGAWHGWFHVMGNTYGTWLHGDARGFRTRHHREHIVGDYRHPPPPGMYDERRARSLRLMKRRPVFLSPGAREVCCAVMGATLDRHGAEVVDLAVASAHFHLLARFACTPHLAELLARSPAEASMRGASPFARRPGRDSAEDYPPRHFVGIAKKAAAQEAARQGVVSPGGIWGRGTHVRQIKDRSHQLQVARYLRAHATDGAVLLSSLGG